MSSGNEILYIKGEKNTEVKEPNVTLGDILTMECSNSSIMNRIKPLRILKIQKKEQHRYVVSVLKIIECIHREIPGLQIQNEGESDLIITYEGEKKRNAIWQGIKVVVVAGITFIGAAFSIMAFNNDVSVTKMFSRIYLLLTGEESNGFTLIELTYCIGLIVGILIFFNHLGRKKFTADPTPMEVEMRLYENDIQETLIEVYGLASGFAVAAGLFSFIIGLGVVSDFADRTHTGKHVMLYENCIMAGGILGNIFWVYGLAMPGGKWIVPVFGLFSGIFVGCWSMALAEILNIFPIFIRRIKILKCSIKDGNWRRK